MESVTNQTVTTGVETPCNQADTALRAELCIKNHVIMAMGVGLVPSALLDVVGIAGLEVNMIRELARLYHFPTPHRLITYKITLSLLGSIGPVYLSNRMHSVLKGVPLVGYAVYIGMLSITGGAAVYAVGKIFQMHFESGGTFLSKDNSLIRDYFKKKYTEGKQVAKDCVDAARNKMGQPVAAA